MTTRLSVRRVGALTGKLVAAPDSLSGLLALATRKLKLTSSATRLFISSGDELEDDDDVLLLRDEEVVYVSCGEDFSPPIAAATAAAEPALPAAESPAPATESPVPESATAAVEPPSPAVEPPSPAVDPPPPAVDPPPPAVEPPPPAAVDPGNPFEIFSPIDDIANAAKAREAAKAEAEAKAKAAAPAAPISEEAARDLLRAAPNSAFAFMAPGGAAAAGGGGNPISEVIKESGAKSSPGLYAFCQNPTEYLQKRTPAPKDFMEGDPPPPLLMGEWEQIKVPAIEAKKDGGGPKLGFKPKLSGLKALFANNKKRDLSS